MQTYIAQAPPPSVAPPPNAWTEWGVLGAILFFIVKEAAAFLKQKDTSESNLTNSLIADIRNTNQELRRYLEAESKANDKTLQALSGIEQRLSRHSAELILDNREMVTKLELKIDALHKRLDNSGVANTNHHEG